MHTLAIRSNKAHIVTYVGVLTGIVDQAAEVCRGVKQPCEHLLLNSNFLQAVGAKRCWSSDLFIWFSSLVSASALSWKIAFWPLSFKMFSPGLLREKTSSHIVLSVGVAIHSLGTKKPFEPTLLVRSLLLTHKGEWLVCLSDYFRYVLINKSSESHPFQANKKLHFTSQTFRILFGKMTFSAFRQVHRRSNDF